jgi:hypothetical protein
MRSGHACSPASRGELDSHQKIFKSPADPHRSPPARAGRDGGPLGNPGPRKPTSAFTTNQPPHTNPRTPTPAHQPPGRRAVGLFPRPPEAVACSPRPQNPRHRVWSESLHFRPKIPSTGELFCPTPGAICLTTYGGVERNPAAALGREYHSCSGTKPISGISPRFHAQSHSVWHVTCGGITRRQPARAGDAPRLAHQPAA